jgi:hypothetical protein
MSTAPSEVLMAPSTKKKVKKPDAVAAVKPAVAKEPDVLVELAHEIESMTEEQAVAAVAPLLETVDSSYIRLGGVLAVIRDHDWWKGKHESFKAMIENGFGLRYRKAMYCVQIYEDLINSGVAWASVKTLGWCKLKEISPVLTTENVDEWVGKAEKMTVLQLHDLVALHKQQLESSATNSEEAESVAAQTTTLTFKLKEDQKAAIQQALDKARKELGTEFNSVALDGICMNYLSGGKTTKPKSLKSVIAGYKPEEVLEAFAETWPDIEVTATLPE